MNYFSPPNKSFMTSSSRLLDHDSIMSLPSLAALVLLAALFPASVYASPLSEHSSPLQPRLDIAPRDTSTSPNSSVKIWVPIIAIIIIIIALAVFYWSKGKGLRFFGLASATAATTPLTQGSTNVREITAEQLAGTINDGTAAANGRTRRTRRPRRTPSQISTTSLPAYNKEPGEEELVIYRGPQDMEDVSMPAATVMPPVDEDGEASLHTGDHSQVSRYTPMPDSPHNMPLLGGDNNSPDGSSTDHPPPGAGMPRRSNDAETHALDETSALARMESNVSGEYDQDPRGEAPPYFEVVDQNTNNNQATVTRRSIARDPGAASSETTAILNATSPPSSPERVQERRSGFRNLLNRMSVHSHARGDSGHSVLTTATSREGGTASRASHRPSHSGSSPLMTSSMFRTLSRQRSTTTLASNRLNSPSLISLNSISSPLTHTAVRTEFTYPKSGPTPEQLKLISSRESFARFGVPYGADAIAFAASASRQDLPSDPPPDFDAAASDVHLPRSAGAAGPSRLRATSRAADLAREDDEDADSSRSSTSLDLARDDEHSLSSPAPADRSTDVTTSTETSISNDSADIPIPEEDEKKAEDFESTTKSPVTAPVMPPTPITASINNPSRKASLKISTSQSNTSSEEPKELKESDTKETSDEENAQSPVMLPTPVSIKDTGVSSKRESAATIVPAATSSSSVPTQIEEEDPAHEPASALPTLSKDEPKSTLAPSPPPTLTTQQSTEKLNGSISSRKLSAPPSSFQAPPSSYNEASSYSRSESRASSFSVQTFETAAETLEYSTPLASAVQTGDSDVSEPGTPTASTPRLGERELEPELSSIAHPSAAQAATAQA